MASSTAAAQLAAFDDATDQEFWDFANKLVRQNSGKPYEEVKAELRERFGQGAVNSKNKARLKALAAGRGGLPPPLVAGAELEPSAADQEFWDLANKLVSYKNENFLSYELVKAELRGRFGPGAVNANNKAQLKALVKKAHLKALNTVATGSTSTCLDENSRQEAAGVSTRRTSFLGKDGKSSTLFRSKR